LRFTTETTTSVPFNELPEVVTLNQNFPNPFNPVTTISYSLPASGHVRLEIFDISGQSVAILLNEVRPLGNHTVAFDGYGMASGVYIITLRYDQALLQRTMMLLK
jgi:hypothetical protein